MLVVYQSYSTTHMQFVNLQYVANFIHYLYLVDAEIILVSHFD